ncbi:MAG: TIGR04211 family SH3 domain-containing protein [Gammaproteobacteria bacterium]
MTTRITATLLLAASLAGGITTTAAEAESRYVSDELEITMRVGASTKQRIISMLESGTEVEVDEPSARDQLETLNAKIQELEAEPEQIRSRLNQLQEDYAKLQKDHQKVVNDKNAITQELAGIRQTAANAINISNERTELRKQLVALKQQVADLQHTNRELSNNRNQNWFMIGAGVVLGSIFIGWLLPYLRFKRRRTSRWSEI